MRMAMDWYKVHPNCENSLGISIQIHFPDGDMEYGGKRIHVVKPHDRK
jgi:hypothetical protein